ncbi:MAG TPA: hypothetical protein DEP99_01710 [Nitrospiraceae bacterium]|nr:hypothetical protein [Nitrospiraceae bacterium]
MGFWSDIKRDYKAVFEKDPAARSALEVIFAYSGFHAILLHRVNHFLWNIGIPVVPRLLSHLSRFFTGIEIHPAAKIGPGFFIDHGMGVVIGETAEIGENALLYQGVTLGGTGKEKGKRHPTLGRNVVVGAGAKILGAIAIGDYVKIGANSVVLNSVPDNSIVVGIPGRIIKKKVVKILQEGPVEMLDHVHLPDPLEDKFKRLEEYILELEKRIEKLEGKGTTIRIHNTLTGKKEEFIPIVPKRVGMYACGVTVYDRCHLGHARSAIAFDVIRKYLQYKGFEVKYVRNFTDIDDKIIAKAAAEKMSVEDVAKKYTDEYYRDMEKLGVERADIEPKATEHIKEIIDIVQALIEKGFAYTADGDVYFEVSKFSGYGKLSKREKDEMLAVARVEINERKRDPMDFALWKASKEGEPAWKSPWGLGRPGWHIECTAMAIKHLGESFDIHGGGADLIFPHHENEIAQSEAFTGKPFVKYWLHNGFITIDREKMSKSLGNFFTIEEVLTKYDPEVVRFFLLSTHYRSLIEFSDEQLKEAEASLDRFYATRIRIDDFLSVRGDSAGGKISSVAVSAPSDKAFEETIDSFKGKFDSAMGDDFNTALALGYIFELVREINRFLDRMPYGEKARQLVINALNAILDAGRVFNLFRRTPKEWYLALKDMKGVPLSEAEILSRIHERQEARYRKDWVAADTIRKELEESGILLEDKKDKTDWKVKV